MEENNIAEIGDRIKNVRQKHNLSIRKFAVIIEIGAQTLIRYEKVAGERDSRYPPADFLHKILAFDTSINPAWLLAGEGIRERIGTSDPFEPNKDDLMIEILALRQQVDRIIRSLPMLANAKQDGDLKRAEKKKSKRHWESALRLIKGK